MGSIVQRIIEVFIDKKRIVGWLSAIAIALGAAIAGMQSQEFKDAVCSAPVIQVPASTQNAK